jgi:hypothetical protein
MYLPTFRDSDLFRHLFEQVLARFIAEGLVGGDSIGVDASLIAADACRFDKIDPDEWAPEKVTRVAQEYLDTLDDAAFGAATPVKPKVLTPSDPAARFTAADHAVIWPHHSLNLPVSALKQTSVR